MDKHTVNAWFDDKETNLIHRFDSVKDQISHCGLSKREDITIVDMGHTPYTMKNKRVKYLSGEEFGYPCPECTSEIICEI